MAECPKCGSSYQEGASFCRICGEPLTAPVENPDVAEERYVEDAVNAAPAEEQSAPEAVAPEAGVEAKVEEAAAPQYAAPAQPQYTAPSQPQYTAPAQPQYTAPAQPQYAAPAQPQYAQPAQPQPQPQYVPVQPYAYPVQVKSEPEMTWGSFFWTRVLFAIPVVGTIFLFIWALGGTSNKTRRQYARSYLFPGLILLGIAVVFFLVVLIIAAANGSSIQAVFR